MSEDRDATLHLIKLSKQRGIPGLDGRLGGIRGDVERFEFGDPCLKVCVVLSPNSERRIAFVDDSGECAIQLRATLEKGVIAGLVDSVLSLECDDKLLRVLESIFRGE